MKPTEENEITPSKESPPKWKLFEQFVASIQSQLTPDAKVICNDKIIGKSGVNRQIDISIRYSLGQFDILAVIDCKYWKKPIDIADVGSFADLVEDVRANKGAVICNAGFTEGAKKRAIEKGIDLMQVVDTENIDWPAKLLIPALCKCRYLKSFSFRFRHFAPTPFAMPAHDPRYLEIYKADKIFNDILFNLLMRSWNEGKLPTEVGKHENLRFIQDDAYTRIKDTYYGPVEITTSIIVEEKIFFGHLPAQNSKGFVDGITGAFTTKNMEFGIDFSEVETKWRRLKTENELAIHPAMVFVASDCYPLIKYLPQTT